MKLPFTIHDSRFTIWKKSSESAVAGGRVCAAGNRQSPIANRKSRDGIALVITLILLSVTLIMAIAFLAISRREAGSVSTSTDTVTARLAADAALANAQAQIIASVLATTNPYISSLLVSTNFINAYGFVPNTANPTNVNYDYLSGGGMLGQNQFVQNVANLLYLPRAPVFVPNPTNSSVAADFRFFLDLNRNGQFETNGLVSEINNLGNPTGATLSEVGDPEWVGVLERPDVPHGPNNKFVSRYAFVAMPADGSLDLNAIHNQALNASLSSISDGYFRNQGVGSWEINLAAFLTDLNTNEWDTLAAPYNYRQPSFANSGFSFQDAFSLLNYRYNTNSLPFASAVLNAGLLPGSVDIFPFGSPLMTSTATPFYNPGLNRSWSGADNTNHYFALSSDLFDPAKVEINVAPPGFIERLIQAGNGVSTYDRYTYYRMLAQLGTDSAPAQNQINLNYSNAAAFYDGNGILIGTAIYPNAETNLVPWQPLQFFTIAADRMLREYSTTWFQASPSNYLATYYGINGYNYYHPDGFGNTITNDPSGVGLTNVPYFGLTNRMPIFGITNIPVLANGQFVYAPAVQRVLQLAANIYDATTNKLALYGKNYPSVFRPVFYNSVSLSGVTNVSIVGYQDVASYFENFGVLSAASAPLDPPLDVNLLPVNKFTPAFPSQNLVSVNQTSGNVYGVPWIIGAKKGFPNFNEFSMENVVQVTRKLQLTRTIANGSTYTLTGTNQMYVFSMTNYLGAEFWNSYSNAYTNANMQIIVRDNLSATLTNGLYTRQVGANFSTTNTYVGKWPGWTNGDNNLNSFVLPLGTNGTKFGFLPSSVYTFGTPGFVNVNLNPPYENYPPTMLPQFGLLTTNRLQVFMLDQDNTGRFHVIDYAHFSGPDSTRNLNTELADPDSSGSPTAYLWSTNLFRTVPFGVINQINVSAGLSALVTPQDGGNWITPPGLPPALHGNTAIEAYFHGFLVPNGQFSFLGANYLNTNLVMQAPYTPTRTMVEYISWQANDPLVHSLVSDLNYSGLESASSTALETGITTTNWSAQSPPILPDLGHINERYQPWGYKVHNYTGTDNNAYNLAYKDPLLYFSDNWDFPSDKLPTVGWLGRVHRGTPWQTVYLKATNILAWATNGADGLTTWKKLTGDSGTFDAENSVPVKDHLLFDNFSTALNDNTTRGQLSVNMGANGPSLASWSALLSGVVTITNTIASAQLREYQPPNNDWLTIGPAGPVGDNSVVGQVVAGINIVRQQFKNSDGLNGVFEHVGDILSVPTLTEQSSFLHLSNFVDNVWVEDTAQKKYGISDEVYEWLPQQTLSLLRVTGTPQSPMRYVIYSYGQTLKPAPNGVVTGGPNLANGTSPFGMVTNYQVVAESATRAVVQVNPVVTTNPNGTLNTNYNMRIEQFNVLPPD